MKKILSAILTFAILTIGNYFWPNVVQTTIPTSILVAVISTIANGVILTALILLVIAGLAWRPSVGSAIVAFVITSISSIIVNGTCIAICTLIFSDFAITNIWALILIAICMNLLGNNASVKTNSDTKSSTTLR